MIRQVISSLRDVYNIDFVSYKPITSKTYKLTGQNEAFYFAKRSNLYTQEKYLFLFNQGIENVLYPLRNRRGFFVTNFQNDNYYVTDYINGFDLINEVKAVNMSHQLSDLHYKTYFRRQLSVSFSRLKMEEIYEYLQYKFSALEAFVRSIESRPFDEYSITILKNYHVILDCKKVMAVVHKRLISDIKEKKSVNYAFVHNNPKLNHLITAQGHHYLTSIEKSKVGIPSLDMAKFYIETEDLNIDVKAIIQDYLSKYQDDFYTYYFYFLVMLYYIKGMVIIDKDYISSQSFLSTTSSLKRFMEMFELNKDKTT